MCKADDGGESLKKPRERSKGSLSTTYSVRVLPKHFQHDYSKQISWLRELEQRRIIVVKEEIAEILHLQMFRVGRYFMKL